MSGVSQMLDKHSRDAQSNQRKCNTPSLTPYWLPLQSLSFSMGPKKRQFVGRKSWLASPSRQSPPPSRSHVQQAHAADNV